MRASANNGSLRRNGSVRRTGSLRLLSGATRTCIRVSASRSQARLQIVWENRCLGSQRPSRLRGNQANAGQRVLRDVAMMLILLPLILTYRLPRRRARPARSGRRTGLEFLDPRTPSSPPTSAGARWSAEECRKVVLGIFAAFSATLFVGGVGAVAMRVKRNMHRRYLRAARCRAIGI